MTNYKTGEKGIDIIKHFEGLNDGDLTRIGLQPKMDPGGIWTRGYGHAMVYNGKFLRGIENKELAYSLSPAMTIQEAEALLKNDLAMVENKLNAKGLTITQNQFDALVSLIFNIGSTAFHGSTLLRRILSHAGGIADGFAMWNKATVKGTLTPLPGLTARRAAEAKLYLS